MCREEKLLSEHEMCFNPLLPAGTVVFVPLLTRAVFVVKIWRVGVWGGQMSARAGGSTDALFDKADARGENMASFRSQMRYKTQKDRLIKGH